MRRPVSFRQIDVKRAVQGAQAAGLAIGAVEITSDGTIRILTGKPEATLTPLERARAERDRRAALVDRPPK